MYRVIDATAAGAFSRKKIRKCHFAHTGKETFARHVSPSDHKASAGTTAERRSGTAFYGKTQTKFPKISRGKQGPQGIRVWFRSQRFLPYRPCAATITGKEMESTKAQRTAVRRDDGLDYGSSADPDAHREDRSQKYEIHFVKWRAG